MKKLLIGIMACGLFACETKTKQQVANDREGVVTQEMKQDQAPPFEITGEQVKSAFDEFLPTISEKRVLNTHDEKLDNGILIKIGDVDGDELEDAVVDYSLEPNMEDTGGGGNAIWEISGVVIYKNTGETIKQVFHSQEYGNGYLEGIENGEILFKVFEYAEEDPRCCPSIEKIEKYKFENNQLVKVD